MSNTTQQTEEKEIINATANEQTANEQTENTTANVTAWERPLVDFEEWEIAKTNLRAWVDDLDSKKLGEVFESKARKTAPFSFQMLAIITHQSAGYIGDKWNKHKENALQTCNKNKEEYNEQNAICEFILNSLAPNLAEERAKREEEERARLTAWNTFVNSVLSSVTSILETWGEFDIPATFNSVHKIVPKYKDKENGLYIIGTLANRTLNEEEQNAIEDEIGLKRGSLCDIYYLTDEDLDRVDEWFKI